MKCTSCKDKVSPDANTDDCEVCKLLPYVVVNDVVYYIYHNSDRATLDYIVVGCELTFYDTDVIVKAKEDFLRIVLDELYKIDQPLADEVKKARKAGTKSKAAMVISDIYNALKALGPAVEVEPANGDTISNVNPEFMCSESLVTRMKEAEAKVKETEEQVQYLTIQIESVIDDNKALKCLLDELVNERKKPAVTVGKTSLAADAAAVAATAIAPAVVAAAAPVVTLESGAEAEPPSDGLETGPVDSGAVAPSDVESDHGYVSPISVGADAATAPPTVEEYRDVAADEAVTSDPILVSAAEVSDSVAADVATPSSLPTTSVGHAPQGIVKQRPKPMPRNVSLRHQRNITAQRMAAATSALAVANGLPNDMAISLGTMAADCVAKNYTTKQQAISYADSIKLGNGNTVKPPAIIAAASKVPQQTPPTNAGHRDRFNKKHKFNSTCTIGTGTIAPNGSSLAYVKPVIPKNKVLVVAGLDKKVNNERLQDHIDKQAGRHVNMIHVIGLNRTINQSRTVAIELDDADYDELSKSVFWEPSIRTWPFKGKHFWYYPKRCTQQEASKSVRESWI